MEDSDTGIRTFGCKSQCFLDISGFQEMLFHIYYIVTEEKEVPGIGAMRIPASLRSRI